jgi:hypothetical protein
MCKKVEDCLFSRTGFRVFVVTLLLLILAGVVLNLGYVPNKQKTWNRHRLGRISGFLLSYSGCLW